ncbi:SPOR domain-containing protein [Luteimonas kalidii]|uniref:SPOR domain-containing protein n=1 Tax=Luteimonas kalidii TaxID=3042025 RepID=A0ABT6JQ36_9GAMM|nr:SPOR domain-containing protein [Luteimonas kalidii]MDH5832617.1 SPOR domain-containing protein [Luteimonas kalidii]
MEAGLKQRLIGAAVLVALAVIFLPMLVKGPAPDSGVSDLSMRVPEAPEDGYRTVDLPLVVPADAPRGGVLPVPEPRDGEPLPTVDTATASPDGNALPSSSGAADPDRQLHASAPAAPAVAAQTDDVPSPSGANTTPLPATTAGGDYAVHFGAFSNARDAQLIVRQLAGAGLTAYAEPFTLNGRRAQRVRLGPYASREAAEVVRVRAAQVRDDVSPRVVALDADAATPANPAAPPRAAVATAATAAVESPASASATSATAATPPPAAADVGFAVQVGAFASAADATRLRDRLRGQGLAAFTDTVDTDKGRLTRVKAGPVATREDAERLKSQVKARAGLDGLVRAHP